MKNLMEITLVIVMEEYINMYVGTNSKLIAKYSLLPV